MRKRTPEEIKAYADGYNDAYEQFKKCLIGRKSVNDAIKRMDIFVFAVNNVIRTDEGGDTE